MDCRLYVGFTSTSGNAESLSHHDPGFVALDFDMHVYNNIWTTD